MAKRQTEKLTGIQDRQSTGAIEKCSSILNKNGIKYTTAEVIIIRDFLYRMAATVWNDYQQKSVNDYNNQLNIISSAA